jgi:hypothetical protein
VAPDIYKQAGILNRLLEISILQRRLIEENRIEELLSAQIERDWLFSTLDLSGKPSADSALKALARELADSDKELSDAVQQVMDSVGSRLGQVKTGMSAVKAYGRY